MDAQVKTLYNVAEVVVPSKYTQWKVSEEELDGQIALLERLSAEETAVEAADAGDCVVCRCIGGHLTDRKVLLYPGLGIPGLENAEKAAFGVKSGEEIRTEINGAVSLVVEKILRRIPRKMDDGLIQSLGIQNVTTVDGYRTWYRETTEENNQTQVLNGIKNYLLDAVAEKSEFEISQEDLDAYAQEQTQRATAELEGSGMPAEQLEEMLSTMKEQCEQSFKRELVIRKICNDQGFVFTPEMFREQLEEMAAQLPDMDTMLDEYRQMIVDSAYMQKVWELLDAQARTFLEVGR